MIGIAKLAHAILGDGPYLNQLACTPTAPASLQVQVAPGQVYQLVNMDATAYSSIAADTTHQILKQGLLMDAVTLSCPAPGAAGQSINYLIEVGYLDTDGGSTVLPYYNSANPAVAENGPNNTGTSQNTIRQGVCSVLVKAGTSAATGTQSTPAADAGYTGAYVVTVANGQTTIIAGNITTVTTAPFITDKLQAKITQVQGDARYITQAFGDGRYGQLAIANTWTQPQTVGNATASGHAINAGQFTAFALIQDVKANGINGGASIVGTQVRTLNTIQYGNLPGVVLSANQITLPAGNYWIEAQVPVLNSGAVQAWLANVTDSTIALIGSSLDSAANATVYSLISGRINIVVTKVFQIVMYCSAALAANGLGSAATAGNNELYTMIKIAQLPV